MDLAHESFHDSYILRGTLVSILVLMDLAHEFISIVQEHRRERVSILVLMDLAHELAYKISYILYPIVSILVLMDLAHECLVLKTSKRTKSCFNPCFNGSCSRITCQYLLLIL